MGNTWAWESLFLLPFAIQVNFGGGVVISGVMDSLGHASPSTSFPSS